MFKRLLPLLWYGLCAVALYSVMSDYTGDGNTLMYAAIPLLGAVAVYCVMRFHYSPLFDVVYSDANGLSVIEDGVEQRVSFADIQAVKHHTMFNPKVLEITLRSGLKPAHVKFIPRKDLFTTQPVAEITHLMQKFE